MKVATTVAPFSMMIAPLPSRCVARVGSGGRYRRKASAKSARMYLSFATTRSARVTTIEDLPSPCDRVRRRVDVLPNWAVGTLKADTPRREEADRTVGRLAQAAGRWCGWLARRSELCRPPDVAVMQATDFADW
jgi:hypothetical protein